MLGAFGAVASPDELTQRRIGQIGEVIGAVEDIADDEADQDDNIAEKRVEEAHDIIHRVAAILAMERSSDDEDGNDGGGGEDGSEENNGADADYAFDEDDGADEDGADKDGADEDADAAGNEPLKEVPWNGKLDGETIELSEGEAE